MESSGSSGGRPSWLLPVLLGSSLVIGIALGVGWYVLGGFPRDHDRYGEVPIPGQQVVSLPEEDDLRLYFENHATRSGDSTHLDDRPEGLEARVVPAAGGEQLEIDDVPGALFSSTSGDRGHEPYGAIDVTEAGDYLVQTTDAASGGFKGAAPAGAAAPQPPSVDQGPAISVGASPWNPGGSKLLGAILCVIAVTLVAGMFTLPFLLIRRG